MILGGVVLAALGRVGEMATFASDTPPVDLDEVSATDVALLRPPMSLWGYNAQATEDALRVIARSVTARDVEIATLRRELADLRDGTGGARATRTGPIPVTRPGDAQAAAPSQPPDPVAAYRPPAPAAETQPSAPAAASGPPGPGAETQPADPAVASGPPAEADPPAEEDWLPIWQRSSEPGSDE